MKAAFRTMIVAALAFCGTAQASLLKDERIAASRTRIEAIAKEAGVAFPLKKPRILVRKKDRVLELFDGEKLVKRYTMALGLVPEGHKQKQGDYKTPEGRYFICNRNYQSAFHLFLGLSYPNAEDAKAALADERIDAKTAKKLQDADARKRQPDWGTGLGGAVGIHGGGVGQDWTWGCIALTDDEVEELWSACPWGTPVEIVP